MLMRELEVRAVTRRENAEQNQTKRIKDDGEIFNL